MSGPDEDSRALEEGEVSLPFPSLPFPEILTAVLKNPMKRGGSLPALSLVDGGHVSVSGRVTAFGREAPAFVVTA